MLMHIGIHMRGDTLRRFEVASCKGIVVLVRSCGAPSFVFVALTSCQLLANTRSSRLCLYIWYVPSPLRGVYANIVCVSKASGSRCTTRCRKLQVFHRVSIFCDPESSVTRIEDLIEENDGCTYDVLRSCPRMRQLKHQGS